MHGEDDRLIRRSGLDLVGEGKCLLQLGADFDAGADLLGQHPCAVRGREGVELASQFLGGGGAAGVADPDRRPVRLRLRRCHVRALCPLLARSPISRDSHGELVPQRGYEDEPRGVVFRGGLPGAGAAGAAGGDAALRAGVAFDRGRGVVGSELHAESLAELCQNRGWL